MYDQAIYLDRFKVDYYNNKGVNYNFDIGVALKKLKRYEEVLKMYDQAILFDPQNADYFYKKGFRK